MATSKDNRWLSSLNQQQLQAVTHGDAPLLIVAGAGTGKTMTLAYRVAYLISQGIPPERILLLTFTRRSRRVNSNETLVTVLKKYFPWCQQWEDELKSLFRSYVDRKQRENVLDYDDLLLYWCHPVVGASRCGQAPAHHVPGREPAG